VYSIHRSEADFHLRFQFATFAEEAPCTGVERFKVVRICEEKPVLICEVEVLEEDDDSDPEVSASDL